MPLTINVGLSRKASKDYQSTGCSINVTAELDQSLLARPDELQQQIDGLYRQAREAVHRQTATASAGTTTRSVGRTGTRSSGYAANGGNGNGHGDGTARRVRGGRGAENGNGNGVVPMTQSQRRAIIAIASRLNVDADAEARDIVGAPLDDLTLRQASDLIDHLKSLQPTAGGR
jgi:hypothetical protein